MHSNRRLLSRTLEMVQFFHFILKMAGVGLFYIFGIRLFWKAVKVKSFVRHVLLMGLYKFWGVCVDIWNFGVRVKDGVLDTIYYRFFHRMLHLFWLHILSPFIFRFVLQIYYKIIVQVYYKVFVQFYYKVIRQFLVLFYYNVIHRLFMILIHSVWPWIKYYILIQTYNFFFYRIKHGVLMVFFKLYGLLFDLVMFSARITKLYLMYPFFKIFWFTRFQYNKRIKKFLA
jgi:hypothetical protein